MRSVSLFVQATVVGLSCLFTPLAHALDTARFKDANGDLVADAPTDASRFVDPSTLIFAYTPVEDPAVYARVWDDFIRHLEKVTGKKVQFFPVQSNAAQIEAMRAGRLHVAGFNTGATPLAVNCAGFVPFAIMAGDSGPVRLRDGDHHVPGQRHHQGRGPQGTQARVHRPRRRTRATRRRRRC